MADNSVAAEMLVRSDVDVSALTVGVLAIQGAFAEHVDALEKVAEEAKDSCRIRVVEVRRCEDFASLSLDGLVIPGGESTTLNVFFRQRDLFSGLKSWATDNRRRVAVWGTCAGLIFLSDNITQEKLGGQLKLGGLSITTCRNFFGRQRQSFEQEIDLKDPEIVKCHKLKKSADDDDDGKKVDGGAVASTFPGVFIRAPGVTSVDDQGDVSVLATVRHGGRDEVVAVRDREAGLMATSFHPELTTDLRFHRLFVKMALEAKMKR